MFLKNGSDGLASVRLALSQRWFRLSMRRTTLMGLRFLTLAETDTVLHRRFTTTSNAFTYAR